MAALAIGLMEQTKALFDQEVARDDGTLDFAVNFSAEIRIIGNKEDLSETEHLIEVKDSDHEDFQTSKKGEIIAGRANNGKEISLNESWVKYIASGIDDTTGPHEIGHTAGLRHPKHDRNYYLWGVLRMGNGPTTNSPESNFMNQGWIITPTGPTKEQMARMYRLYQAGELNRKDNVPIEVN